jgi:tetratricopeptide (TPR) repeat protein
MLRFAENVSYGDQGVAMVDRDRGFKLFEAAKNPREILKLLTGYLSQLPVDWNAWNKMGAVLRALSFPQSALSAHTQALNTGGINATTLAHLAKDHEVAGNINFAKLYAEEVLRGYYPHSDKAWAIKTAEGIRKK